MAENSKIQWCDHTFNPWIGCTWVSPGCAHCYAKELMEDRYKRVEWGAGKPRVRTTASTWREPLRWNKQAAELGTRFKVFCASLADVFDPEVPREWRRDLCELIELTRNLDWLALTKRPENVNSMIAGATGRHAWAWLADCDHVWIGTSIENQVFAERRLPILSEIQSSVRFLSCEPLLGEVDLTPWMPHGFEWAIVGGESGPKARPFDVAWARKIVEDCQEFDVAPFVKQLGARPFDGGVELHLQDRKAGTPSEWPEGLVVREFPNTAVTPH